MSTGTTNPRRPCGRNPVPEHAPPRPPPTLTNPCPRTAAGTYPPAKQTAPARSRSDCGGIHHTTPAYTHFNHFIFSEADYVNPIISLHPSRHSQILKMPGTGSFGTFFPGKGHKFVEVKDLPRGSSYVQSDHYQGSAGIGLVAASARAPSIGHPSFPRGSGSLVEKVKK